MTTKHLIPYIHLNGTAGRAIALYEKALGATPKGEIARYSQAPMPVAPEHKDWVMHATLVIGDALLMLSDATPDHAVPTTSNLSILIEINDEAELQQKFDALAVGGTIDMPVHDAFWGGKFGVLVDAFGVRWNFHSGRMA